MKAVCVFHGPTHPDGKGRCAKCGSGKWVVLIRA